MSGSHRSRSRVPSPSRSRFHHSISRRDNPAHMSASPGSRYKSGKKSHSSTGEHLMGSVLHHGRDIGSHSSKRSNHHQSKSHSKQSGHQLAAALHQARAGRRNYPSKDRPHHSSFRDADVLHTAATGFCHVAQDNDFPSDRNPSPDERLASLPSVTSLGMESQSQTVGHHLQQRHMSRATHGQCRRISSLLEQPAARPISPDLPVRCSDPHSASSRDHGRREESPLISQTTSPSNEAKITFHGQLKHILEELFGHGAEGLNAGEMKVLADEFGDIIVGELLERLEDKLKNGLLQKLLIEYLEDLVAGAVRKKLGKSQKRGGDNKSGWRTDLLKKAANMLAKKFTS